MVTGKELAAMGSRAIGEQINYADVDCQAFMELIFQRCGQKINYAGSNDMYRNACTWVGTIEEAKKKGYLVPGAALFIVENDGNEPEKYKADGKGNASHVGMYVGSNALTDVDKNGKLRSCDVVHSSASMGRVAGSTLKNAWTHVGLWKNVDFNVNYNNDPINQENGDENMGNVSEAATVMYVNTANGMPVNFRKKADRKADLVPRVPEIPNGGIVTAHYTSGEWTKITYAGYDGYVMSEFLSAEPPQNVMEQGAVGIEVVTTPPSESDETLGSIDERATLYRVYIDFKKKKDAIAFQEAMQSCQVGSVKK